MSTVARGLGRRNEGGYALWARLYNLDFTEISFNSHTALLGRNYYHLCLMHERAGA